MSSINNSLGGGFGNGVVPKNFYKSETAEAVKLIRGRQKHPATIARAKSVCFVTALYVPISAMETHGSNA